LNVSRDPYRSPIFASTAIGGAPFSHQVGRFYRWADSSVIQPPEAEKVRGKLRDAQKALLFPTLARLIRRGELGGATRRMAQRDEFDAEKQRLIAHLSSEEGGRLLLAGDTSVEIAHEALIT
jgi:hypothetical protein